MRINAAYKEGLKKILETGDMSRVKYEDAIKKFLSHAEETQED